MSSDPKAPPSAAAQVHKREKGVMIFTYPKIIFIFPTLIMSLICWVGMLSIRESAVKFNYERILARRELHKKAEKPAAKAEPGDTNLAVTEPVDPSVLLPRSAFKRPENVLGLIFLTVLFLNLMILAIDFPRFTILAIILGGSTLLFLFLYLTVYFDIIGPLVRLLEGVYIVANYEFYLLFAMVLLVIYGVVYISRYLDYWEILPNEILHHHGPLSDLERYPTLNLKFDKEIPDVFEHFMFGAGRLVLHVSDERKSIVLDNVLWVSRKEEALKKLMSRLEVRVTTDQEVGSS
jgi:hypothetical protein